MPRLSAWVADRGTTGTIAAMWLWAGESVGAVAGEQTARQIIDEMAGTAERLLRARQW